MIKAGSKRVTMANGFSGRRFDLFVGRFVFAFYAGAIDKKVWEANGRKVKL